MRKDTENKKKDEGGAKEVFFKGEEGGVKREIKKVILEYRKICHPPEGSTCS